MKLFKTFLILSLFSPNVSFAFEKSFKGLVDWFISIIEMAIPVIFSLSVLIILWGIFKYIFLSQGDEKQIEESRNIMFYGIIGLFVMVSVWGLVKVLTNSVGGGFDDSTPPSNNLPTFPQA